MTQDSESVVVPRDQQRQLDAEQLMDAAGTLSRCGYGEDAEEVRAIALRLAAAPSTSVREDHVRDAPQLIDHSAAIKHLRDRARGFRQAAFMQGKRAGPLAMGFEAAADDLAALVPSTDEGKRHG